MPIVTQRMEISADALNVSVKDGEMQFSFMRGKTTIMTYSLPYREGLSVTLGGMDLKVPVTTTFTQE